MHRYLLRIWLNDENGNKTTTLVTYSTYDDELKVKMDYDRYRNTMQVDAEGQSTGNRMYTVEFSKCTYKTLSKTDADAWMAEIIE